MSQWAKLCIINDGSGTFVRTTSGLALSTADFLWGGLALGRCLGGIFADQNRLEFELTAKIAGQSVRRLIGIDNENYYLLQIARDAMNWRCVLGNCYSQSTQNSFYSYKISAATQSQEALICSKKSPTAFVRISACADRRSETVNTSPAVSPVS